TAAARVGIAVWAAAVLVSAIAAARAATGTVQPATVTFTEHVAPILFDACAGCHRPGGPAPFPLLTYDDARARAALIAEATANRRMPPWKPEPGYGEFVGERRLTEVQIATLRAWVDQGAPEGDPRAIPPAPRWTGEWQLGEPDLILETPPYTLPAGDRDVYRNFVVRVPRPLPPDGSGRPQQVRYVRAWQFLPGNPHVVHHATIEFDTTGAARRLDDQDPQPGYEGLIPHTVQKVEGFFLGWTPGHMTYVAPDGLAWPVRSGSDLVMMLHLRPHIRPEPVQARLGLYFADTPPALVPTLVRLTRQDLDIPAGESRYVATDTFTLPVDVDAYTIQPHAHYLARELRAFALRPDGTRQPLIVIRDWDFDWQGVYTYRRPVPLPAGTMLTMEWVYDNSEGNRRNPHRPPRRVTYGQDTTDEMAELWIQVVARSPRDRLALARAIEAKVMLEEIVGLEKRLERDPADTALHNDVALLYVAAGNLERAARHFAEVLRLEPDSPAAHYNLGNVLAGLGRAAEAGELFTKALALKPDYALAHDGLARVRRAEGRLEDALAHHREALRLDPRDADAHYSFGLTLRLLGRAEEARAAWQEALRLDPAHAGARAELEAMDGQRRQK
ncbi:MAG TPA: tetratricopeptide repeat protein, partial [Vicinamibacterales bacterium]|nr:tetratricopeptide repeat protein [Vicinamibacterales bacterium]